MIFCRESYKFGVARAWRPFTFDSRSIACERMKINLAAAIVVIYAAKKKWKRSCWVRKWIAQRPKFGAYASLLNELAVEDPGQYKNFLRMVPEDLEDLPAKIGPVISRQETRMRQPIPAKDKLALTLRFLASGKFENKSIIMNSCIKLFKTGDSYASLALTFRIP